VSFSLENFVEFLGMIAAFSWFVVALARLSRAWSVAQGRMGELKRQQTTAAKQLLKEVQEIARLGEETKEAKKKADAVRADCAAKQKEIAAMKPLPADEILVTSEYPPAKADRAWTITLNRNTTSRAKSPDSKMPMRRHYLVWARDHTGAVARARQILGADPDYDIEGAQLFTS
jgi:hypothetical protein